MIVLQIIGVLLLLVLLLLLIAVARTLLVKPTAAKTATPPASDEVRAAEYAKILSEMIKVETVSSRFDPSREKFDRFQEEAERLFPTLFKACEVYKPGHGLILKLPAAGEAKGDPILFMSHHDVVEAPGAEHWAHPPFSGDIDEEGNVWGRGTVDTKGALFCEMKALEELIQSGWKPEVDVYITSSCTEEWSGDSCPAIVDWLREHNVHLGMLMDEGGMVIEEPVAGAKGRYCVVGVLEKGYGDLKFTARSKGGHASAPPKKSPLPRLGMFMADVEKHNPFKVEITPTVREMFRRLAPNMGFGMRMVFTNLWLFAPLLKKLMPSISAQGAAMMQTTCAFTTAKGSDGLNVMPSEAWVTANMRFIHHQPNEESIAIMKALAEKYGLETEVITQDRPCKPVDYTGAPFRLLEKTAAKIYPGYGVVPYVMTGGTDAKYYGDVTDHALRFAPIEINQQQFASIHAFDENISSKALVPAVDFYKQILLSYPQEL